MPRGSAPGERRGGRQKGTPNRTTARARALVLGFLEARTADEIKELWEAAKGESATNAFRMWLQAQDFVLPKLAKHEVTGEDGGPVEFVIRDLAKENDA